MKIIGLTDQEVEANLRGIDSHVAQGRTASRDERNEGAGLGLGLVQWIVEQHHGRIEVKSEPGKGSCFTVRLPVYS